MPFRCDILRFSGFLFGSLTFGVFSSFDFGQDATKKIRSEEILNDWIHWVARCTDEMQPVKITEKLSGRDKDTIHLIELSSKDRFHWSHRYSTPKGNTENIAAGNSRYAFTLTNRSGDFQLADLKTHNEADFKSYYASARNKTPLTNMLLGGGSDSILSLVASGKVEKFQLIDERTAKLVVAVSDVSDMYDISTVSLTLALRSSWLPKEVSWQTQAVPSGERSMTTYRYSDWISVGRAEMPTVIESIAGRNGIVNTYRNELSYSLSEEESADICRFYLNDFGFPEPNIPSVIPNWVWFVFVGAICLSAGVWMRWRGQSSAKEVFHAS